MASFSTTGKEWKWRLRESASWALFNPGRLVTWNWKWKVGWKVIESGMKSLSPGQVILKVISDWKWNENKFNLGRLVACKVIRWLKWLKVKLDARFWPFKKVKVISNKNWIWIEVRQDLSQFQFDMYDWRWNWMQEETLKWFLYLRNVFIWSWKRSTCKTKNDSKKSSCNLKQKRQSKQFDSSCKPHSARVPVN